MQVHLTLQSFVSAAVFMFIGTRGWRGHGPRAPDGGGWRVHPPPAGLCWGFAWPADAALTPPPRLGSASLCSGDHRLGSYNSLLLRLAQQPPFDANVALRRENFERSSDGGVRR